MTKNGSQKQGTAIAIIGMGCIFPKSRHLKEYWHLLFNGVDAIEQIPESHWRLSDYFNPDPSKPDHTYCKRGGFLPPVSFDPSSYGIPPNNLEATDTSQLLGLEVAKMALEDAGYAPGHPLLETQKVNVVLGVTGTQELVIPLGARLGHPIWNKAIENSGISEDKRKEILQRIQSDYVEWQENSFPGLLGNVVAGRIANRFNLSGTNTVCDAACASSLSALHTSIMELCSHKCDMSITGGADTLNDIFMHMCFSKTGVLSHTSDARPFSKDADGTVLGEGIGMLVLKRLEDAEKDNDRIYAVIKGVGTSSDGRTSAIYAPDAKGQIKALKEAYDQAGFDPETVGMIEAHGTGTRVGDKVEFQALKACFDCRESKNKTAIGSVKSMIGHTKAAAGVAGLIKSALALHNKVIPPTLKANDPDPELEINSSSFYLNTDAKPWINSSGKTPRRSGVSAFGFGGSNFHAVLEEYKPGKQHVSWDGSIQIFAFSAPDKNVLKERIKSLIEALSTWKDPGEISTQVAFYAWESRTNFKQDDDFRLVMVHNQKQDVLQNLQKAIAAIESGENDKNIYLGQGKKTGKLGFLFPGQGSQYPGMGKDLLSVFPEALETMEKGVRAFAKAHPDDLPLNAYIFAPPVHLQSKKKSEELLRNTKVAQPAIGSISLGLARILKRFNVTPDAVCGHSYGELSALCCAGWMDENTFLDLSVERGRHMAAAGESGDDPGSMLAVQAPLNTISTLITENDLDLVLANRNSPSQGVLSGSTSEIQRAKKICKENKIRAIQLPVAAAFHSRLVKDAAAPFTTVVQSKNISPSKVKVLSNTSGTFYPKNNQKAGEILGQQLANPVLFVDNILQMKDDDVRFFIEVGPKPVLTGLAKSILDDDSVFTVACDDPSKKMTGLANLAHVLAQLAAFGFGVDLTAWEDKAEKPAAKKMRITLTGANPKPKKKNELPVSKPEPKINRKPDHSIKTPEKPAPKNRSGEKGSEMTINRQPNPSQPIQAFNSTASFEAMQMVSKGLEAMQQLQAQTAKAHEKFLETQAEATRTLAGMIEQTKNLAASTANDFAYAIPERSVPAPYPASAEPKAEAIPVQQPAPKIDPVEEDPTPVPKTEGKQVGVEPPKTENSDNKTLEILFGIVSELTGFPVEMLEPEMDIESDLGIDSIKKVEIISELEKKIPSCEGLTPDNIGSVRTLGQICEAITNQTVVEDSVAQENAPVKSESKVLESDGDSDNALSTKVEAILVETISELTGFPVEMLEASMDLESDLGIDSIKRVEILSKLEQQLDHIDAISPDDIATLKTIGEITQYLTAGRDIEKKTAKKKLQKQPSEPQRSAELKKLTRQTVVLKKYPTNQIRFYNGSKIDLPKDGTVYITKDSAGISKQFVNEFKKLEIRARLLDLDKKGSVQSYDDAAGIVLVPDIQAQNSLEDILAFYEKAFELVKANASNLMAKGDKKGAFLTGISFMGGTFGFSSHKFATDPMACGLPGFIKTAAIELKNVLCRALDMPDTPEKCLKNAEAAVALMMTHGSVEMGLDGETCYIPELAENEVDLRLPDVEKDDVFVITGGAKGVTAACALELAGKFAPTIVLIGRSKLQDEPDWTEDLFEPAELKKAILTHAFEGKKAKPADVERHFRQIMSNREIRKNISQMATYGSTVRYFSADVKNEKEIRLIFDKVRKTYGRITGLIHGAGVLEDKRIVDKHVDQFTNVVRTKVVGLHAILNAAAKDRLRYLILFSSVAARTGNQGQSDYALANEILNKSATKFQETHPQTRVVSVNWGPWEGGMVDLSLKKEFEKRGIDLIPLESGARQLLTEMAQEGRQRPEVVIGAHLVGRKNLKKQSEKVSRVATEVFGAGQMPVLNSHWIAGEPVVPFALLAESLGSAAQKANPGLVLTGIDQMRLLKGIRGKNSVDANVNLGKCRPTNSGLAVFGTITSKTKAGIEHPHTQATLLLKEKRPKPPVLSKAAFMSLEPYPKSVSKAYEEVLFHGPDLQGIVAVNGYSKKGIEVVTKLAPKPSNWFLQKPPQQWTIEPMMLDAAFQAAILWTYETRKQVCLPSFFASLRLYSSFDGLKGNVRILFTVNEETQSKIKGYFTFLNEADTVVASIMGYEAIVDPDLFEKFKNKPLFNRESILAFAQGNPSEAFGEKYKVFDKDREIARLPRPPYFFMDRVISVEHPQWKMQPGGDIEAQYEVPADAWYFKANRTDTMPFCILLEIALQPCGWLAAFAGSALQSDHRLHFRNLGGKAVLLKPVDRHSGTLTVRCNLQEVSKAGGMIIQDFKTAVYQNGEAVYKGTTNFGFFTGQALANQVGIRNSRFESYHLPDKLCVNTEPVLFEQTKPLTPDDNRSDRKNGLPAKALMMIDHIEQFSLQGGLYENGYVKAQKEIDSKEWFFDAHFYQDPVCPGSLGVESFLQCIRFYLLNRFEIDPEQFEGTLASGQSHEWIYRGQIIPKNKLVDVHVHIRSAENMKDAFFCQADGALTVDGICIYEMTNFVFAFHKAGKPVPNVKQLKAPKEKM